MAVCQAQHFASKLPPTGLQYRHPLRARIG